MPRPSHLESMTQHHTHPRSPLLSVERWVDVGPKPSPPGLQQKPAPAPPPMPTPLPVNPPPLKPFSNPEHFIFAPFILAAFRLETFSHLVAFFLYFAGFLPEVEEIPGSEDSAPLCEPKGTEPYEIQWSAIVPLSTPQNFTQGATCESAIRLRCVHSLMASFISVFCQRSLWLMDRQPRRSASPDPRPSWMPTDKVFYVDNHVNL